MEEIGIVYRKISDLTLLDDNPRKISKRDLERLVDSIRINGFWKHRPIALSEREGKLYVLAGHQRIKAAKKLKISEVPTILLVNRIALSTLVLLPSCGIFSISTGISRISSFTK